MTAYSNHKLYLTIILTGYLFIGIAYMLVNPLWEAPDELHHFSMIHYVKENDFTLPSQESGTIGLWQQEGNQPPLYYFLSALLIQPNDTSDIDAVMRINPHADIGIIRPDGNVNRIVHHPDEGFPSSNAELATYIVRFFSLVLGAGTIIITYQIGREIFPEQPYIALGAAGINAFIPMVIYISASVNNDNLSTLLASGLILKLIWMLTQDDLPGSRSYIILGILTGAGLLSKLNMGLTVPLVILTLLAVSVRLRNWRPVVIGGAISGILTILIAGWWYWRNWQLFGDPTGLDRFLDIVGRRASPADLRQLWTERDSFIRTFWGLFGSINVPMPELVYSGLNLIGAIGLVGGAIYSGIATLKPARMTMRKSAVLLLFSWIILVFIGLLRWTSITPASQGRLIYGAISGISLWMAVGLGGWLPPKVAKWVLGIIVGAFALIAFTQPFLTIAPAYRPAEPAQDATPIAIYHTAAAQIALVDTRIPDEPVTPGDYLEFDVDFKALTDFDRNWSIFVHLVSTDNEAILAQRDIYPGRGLMATSDLSADTAWQNPIAVYIPETTYTPDSVDIQIGWYHVPTGERMKLDSGAESMSIGTIELVPAESTYDVPNSLQVKFGNQIELIGYDLSQRSANPGESIELTLYWHALRQIEDDYVVFAQIIDRETLTKFADSNAMPAAWTRPTSTWEVGEIIVDQHTLTIYDEAIQGVYPIEIGLYLQEEGFPRLGILGTYDNSLYLPAVRIIGGDS